MNVPIRPYLPFTTIESLTYAQKNTVKKIIGDLVTKTKLDSIQTYDLFVTLSDKSPTSEFLNRMLIVVETLIPHLSEMHKGRDYLLNKEIEQHKKKLKKFNNSFISWQNKVDELLCVFKSTCPKSNAFKETLNPIGQEYTQFYLHDFPEFDKKHGDLLEKIKTRISTYQEKAITKESLALIVNIHDFDLKYLENNLLEFKERTDKLKLRRDKILSKIDHINKIQKKFDKDFSQLHYFIENGGNTTFNRAAFKTSYVAGKYATISSYSPQDVLAIDKKKESQFTEPEKSIVLEIFDTLAKKTTFLFGDHFHSSSNHPALLALHFWTPCPNTERKEADQNLIDQVVELNKTIENIISTVKKWHQKYELGIKHSPQLRQQTGDLRPDDIIAYQQLNPHLAASASKFISLNDTLTKRIALQVKLTISNIAFDRISHSLDIPLKQLQDNLSTFQTNTTLFIALQKELLQKKDTLHQEITKFRDLFNKYSEFFENELKFTWTNDLWVSLFGNTDYIGQKNFNSPPACEPNSDASGSALHYAFQLTQDN